MKKLILLLHFTFSVFHFAFSQTAPGIEWQNTIGGTLNDDFSSMNQTLDGGYIIGGQSGSNISSDKTENSMGVSDYWLLKLYPDTTTGIPNIQPPINNIQLYPNPAKDEITITGYTLQNNQPTQLRIFDVMGKEVYSSTITTTNKKLSTKNFTSGVYYVQVGGGDNIARAKFVKT